MNHPATADSAGGHGGIGSKIKGAAQTVNGLGENVRGTILGGVDTILHKDSSANDAIAAKGRAQHAEGMANLEGRSVRPTGTTAAPTTTTDYNTNSAANPPTTGTGTGYGAGYNGTHNEAAPAPAPGGDPYFSKVNQEASRGHHTAGTMNSNPYDPYHDPTAVAQNIPAYDGPGNAQQHLARGDRPMEEPRHHRDDAISDVNAGQMGTGVPPKYVTTAGGPPTDVGAQYRGDEVM